MAPCSSHNFRATLNPPRGRYGLARHLKTLTGMFCPLNTSILWPVHAPPVSTISPYIGTWDLKIRPPAHVFGLPSQDVQDGDQHAPREYGDWEAVGGGGGEWWGQRRLVAFGPPFPRHLYLAKMRLAVRWCPVAVELVRKVRGLGL